MKNPGIRPQGIQGCRENSRMQQSFPPTASTTEKCAKLHQVIRPEDALAILIAADPDALASALALRRIFWRKVKKIGIYRINTIDRADNMAMIRLLDIGLHHIRKLKRSEISKWALLDSQPSHHDIFKKFKFDIIIDHHPPTEGLSAGYLDIKADYGANSTILTEYLKAQKIKPSPRIATALFYGIKTDTDNFVRASNESDIRAFRYLYKYANMNIIKKMESSEMTLKTLSSFKQAMKRLIITGQTAMIYMGQIEKADTLVMLADFFLKLVEATWCIVSGIVDRKLIVIFRSAGFRRDAGKLAELLFGELGSAGGHRNASRAEIPVNNIATRKGSVKEYGDFVLNHIKKKMPA